MKQGRRSSIDRANMVEVIPVTTNQLLASALKMKANRAAKMEDPKPLLPERYAHYKKAFLCRSLFGDQMLVFPTPHSIDRFRQRYHYVDHHFYPKNENELLNNMRLVFNSCKHTTDIISIERNNTHGAGNEIISWGNELMNFIVDTKSLSVVTFELCGPLAKYNRR